MCSWNVLCCLLPASSVSCASWSIEAWRGTRVKSTLRFEGGNITKYNSRVNKSILCWKYKSSLSFFVFFSSSPYMKWDKTVIKYAIKGIKGFVKIWGIWSSANCCSACVAEFDFFFFFISRKVRFIKGFFFPFLTVPLPGSSNGNTLNLKICI